MIMNCLVPKESLASKTGLVFKSFLLVELWKVSEVDLIIWPTRLLYKVNIINEHLISCILKENCFGRKDCSWVAFDSLFSNAYLPGSAGKSCLLGGLHSIFLFGIPRVIQAHLYLGFHHVLFCCKYQFIDRYQPLWYSSVGWRCEIPQLHFLQEHLPEM